MERTENVGSKADFFMAANAGKFEQAAMSDVYARIKRLSDDQLMIVSAGEFRDPTAMLLVAVFLGWERFFLDDIVLGIFKIITLYGLGIWWLVDIFTVTRRTKRYNYNRLLQMAGR